MFNIKIIIYVIGISIIGIILGRAYSLASSALVYYLNGVITLNVFDKISIAATTTIFLFMTLKYIMNLFYKK